MQWIRPLVPRASLLTRRSAVARATLAPALDALHAVPLTTLREE
jgi:hypothetical protein